MARAERKNINVATLEKIRRFLKEQDEPVFISAIVKQVGVDCHSVKLALTMLNIRTNKDRRVKLK
ncbi:MAG TPA: hypothetical protein VMX17_06285 [Candidatus Glassbacteria bacterium]|nr:hypothetical protein [Candidatus Glassbacteria bacterium]